MNKLWAFYQLFFKLFVVTFYTLSIFYSSRSKKRRSKNKIKQNKIANPQNTYKTEKKKKKKKREEKK